MLSQENINKLHMDGLYRCNPKLELLPEYKRADPYWCMNWTFTPQVSRDGIYSMRDTYWSGSSSLTIELTDENIDDFILIFDFNEVEEFRVKSDSAYRKWLCYNDEDTFHVPVDSGGLTYAKYFIKKNAVPDKQKIINRLQEDITSLKDQLNCKHKMLEKVINNEINLKDVWLW